MCPLCPVAELTAAIDPRTDARLSEREQLAQIDASVRGPVILFLTAAVIWLLAATLAGLVCAYKLNAPEFLGNIEWLTYGRVRAFYLDAATFGWANNVAFAVGLWIMARLSRARVRHLGLLYVAGAFWNFGVLWGLASILLGGMTSVEWLEMPPGIGPVLEASFVLISLWAVLCYQQRQVADTYVAQWYLLGAWLWFPWVFFAAELAIFWMPLRGTLQAGAQAWYVNNLWVLWYAPMALAAIYYLLPKILGRPLYAYYLAPLGFWALALFGSWAGGSRLLYGPVPVWLQTTGVIASVVLTVPAVAISLNLLPLAWAHARQVWRSPSLRFIVFGACAFTLAIFIGALTALRGVSLVTHFSEFTVAHAHHYLYGFYSMTMFGAVYFMLPRILGREWPWPKLINAHFALAAIGLTLLVADLYLFGWMQGLAMNQPDVPFLDIVRDTATMNVVRTAAGALMAAGHLLFFLNLAGMLLPLAGAVGVRWTRVALAGDGKAAR